ncbi:MAG: hypothetical protein AAFN08_00760 [Cyanobacteria bacterium J06559_3]
MAQYIDSGRDRPCPICGRTQDQGCHWNDDVVFCHTYVNQNAAVEGYVYRGATADGLWGQYFVEASQPALNQDSRLHDSQLTTIQLDISSLQVQIRGYLVTDPSELELATQVLQWHREAGLTVRDIRSLVKPIRVELQQTEERGDSPIGEASPTHHGD